MRKKTSVVGEFEVKNLRQQLILAQKASIKEKTQINRIYLEKKPTKSLNYVLYTHGSYSTLS